MARTLFFVAFLLLFSISHAQMSFTGAGVLLSSELQDGHAVIRQVLKFSPAADAGLQAGETVWSVDGKPTDGKASKDVALMIKGTDGQVRTLVVGDDKHTVQLTLRLIKGQCTDGDCITGEGRIEEPTGDIYRGEFQNGKFHGYGMYYYYTGEHMYARYDGQFVNGKKEGEGTLENYDAGYQYSGGFKADQAQGKGTITFHTINGNYTGNFSADKPAGAGTLTLADGSVETVTPATIGEILQLAGAVKEPEPVVQQQQSSTSGSSNDSGSSSWSSSSSTDFSGMLSNFSKAENAFSYALDAYADFHQQYRDAMMAYDAATAESESLSALNKCIDYLQSGYNYLVEANSVLTSAELTTLEAEAIDDYNAAIANFWGLFSAGFSDDGTTPSAWYWMNVNVDRGEEYLEAAAAARHSF